MKSLLYLPLLLSHLSSSVAQNEGWYLCTFMPWICPPDGFDETSNSSRPSITPGSEIPSAYPSYEGTAPPSLSSAPTATPTDKPTKSPTKAPIPEPSPQPTDSPSNDPTDSPTMPHRPNLIMILTDQQSVRTLGCYRELFKKDNQNEQAHVWGDGIEVETPHIDKLAEEGTLFSNFHTVAPLCTPSRASFMSGLYPQKTGDTGDNHGEMDENITTFAKVLKAQKMYYTGYFGKWHLDGLDKPGWGKNKRKFGFEDNKYLWNRGHWKFIDEINGTMKEYEFNEARNLFEGVEDKHFTTDYLFDRGIDFIEKAKERSQPFAMVLSIPDPHSPNDVRQPYQNMYTHMNFGLPLTTMTTLTKNPAGPDWNYHEHENVTIDKAETYLKNYEQSSYFQNYMHQYFGMVKCIDDNVGKLMRYLKSSGIDGKETIIVFTSDHGNMLGEHGKMNKGRPYRGAAAVPFIVRYPGFVPQGKLVKTAHSSIDFAPSILSLMGVTDDSLQFDGKDFTKEMLNAKNMTNWGEIVFSFDTGKSPVWAAAIKRHYKLVVSAVDTPWLFDLQRDPYEIINYFDDSDYTVIKNTLLDALFVEMNEHDIPLRHHTQYIFWSTPECMDTKDRISIGSSKYITCADLNASSDKCSKWKFKTLCPQTCGPCCKNSLNKPFWLDGELKQCVDLKDFCNKGKVQQLCPVTCAKFTGCRDTN